MNLTLRILQQRGERWEPLETRPLRLTTDSKLRAEITSHEERALHVCVVASDVDGRFWLWYPAVWQEPPVIALGQTLTFDLRPHLLSGPKLEFVGLVAGSLEELEQALGSDSGDPSMVERMFTAIQRIKVAGGGPSPPPSAQAPQMPQAPMTIPEEQPYHETVAPPAPSVDYRPASKPPRLNWRKLVWFGSGSRAGPASEHGPVVRGGGGPITSGGRGTSTGPGMGSITFEEYDQADEPLRSDYFGTSGESGEGAGYATADGGDEPGSATANAGAEEPVAPNGVEEPAMTGRGVERPVALDGGEQGPVPTAGTQPPPAPTRSVYGSIECEDVVKAGEVFEVEVGLAPQPSAGVASTRMEVPAREEFDLDVQLVVFGFELAEGEAWRRKLHLTGADPFPKASYYLRSEPGVLGVKSLEAKYALKGEVIGIAVRAIRVVEGSPASASPPPVPEPAELEMPSPDSRTPDLTLTIFEDEDSEGVFACTIDTAGAQTDPDRPHRMRLGTRARDFARDLIQRVKDAEGSAALELTMRALSRRIHEELPGEFFEALERAGAAAQNRRPTVLIISAEPYIPWELAQVKALDPAAPSFLAAQATVGRWPIARKSPPPKSPVQKLGVSKAAFVSGVYDDPSNPRLIHAEEEVKKLAERFGVTPVGGTFDEVLDLLTNGAALGLVHFALHGKFDPSGRSDGLILVDGRVLDPTTAEGSTLAATPLVFLNACQVGTGNELLGDYAGMAVAFLRAGASAVIAPLWSIDDEKASEVALSFYDRAISEKAEAPAEVLRDVRCQYLKDPKASTPLAYQFFGHPCYRVEYIKEPV